MKNSKLIELLQQLPLDVDVAIADWKLNMMLDESSPGAGIYEDFDIELVQPDAEESASAPWISLQFSNPPLVESDPEPLEEKRIITLD